MKRTILLLVLSAMALQAAAEPALWLRKSAISPDGQTIAFAWQGDIWAVSADGGAARQLTSNPAYESDPMWSRDGKTIVFTSYRELSKDIWAMPVEGGAPARLTDYPGAELPLAVTASGDVLFSANIQQDPAAGFFPGGTQLYSVSLAGGRPKLVSSIETASVSVNADGLILYEDNKGYEDSFRKHHTSSVTRDIWKYDPAAGTFDKLTTFVGENRNPVFAADGKCFFFLSEESGSFNVWYGSVSKPGEFKNITNFKTHPVRYLSVSEGGRLCFSYNGELFICDKGAQPRKLEITVPRDPAEREVVHQSISLGLSSMAVSPNGKEIAVVARGDVYVTAVDVKATRRITDTPQQERGVSFGDGGRTLYYAAERDGEWAIWKTTLRNKEDKYFSVAYEMEEERVTDKGQTCFGPDVSPDGKWLAFLRDRQELVIKNIKSGAEKSLFKDVNYSYSDGDLGFEWSPDSKYILTDWDGNGGWHNPDVAMIDIESGEITDLTLSGYDDGRFSWAMGGKAMTWTTDRDGYRSHGSWGAHKDVYAMFFDGKTFADFRKSKGDAEIDKFITAPDKKKDEKKDSTETAKPEKKAFKPNLEDLEYRTVRLTPYSSQLGAHYLTPDGLKLYFASRQGKSMDLCCLDIKEGSVKVVKKGFSGFMVPDKDGKYLYIASSLGVSRMDIKSGTTKSISFSGEYDYRPAAERAYIFEHCWKQVSEKFYDKDIHGVGWTEMHDNYSRFLPYIANNYDFQELLSEMLGELNGSHTGARYRPTRLGAPGTGFLGVFYDESWTGKGLKIAEVIRGGVLSTADPEIGAGDIILAIDGKEIGENAVWYEELLHKGGKRIQLVVKKGCRKETLYVTADSSNGDLLYRRWVSQREEMVKKLSGGKIGYVHVRSMKSESFREVFSKALGKYHNCDALIVDTRHNGGGWLHDDLVDFLGGKVYVEYRPRGRFIAVDPYDKWTKPSCVLMGEDNYSDACGFPYAYRSLGLGKLIGAPVPGTMTAVWWETQIDKTLVFGIPQVTSWGMKDDRPLENFQIEPDILVYNDPASELRGEDRQLEAAVAEMLKETAK